MRRSTDVRSRGSYVRGMDPDLFITICFVGLVFLFGLVFAFFIAHEANQPNVATVIAPERGNRQDRQKRTG